MSDLKYEIVFNNDDIIIVNKMPGIVVIERQNNPGENSLIKTVSKQLNLNLLPVNSMDKDASGLVVFAKNEESQKFVFEQFSKQTIERIYTVLLAGVLTDDFGEIDKPIISHGDFARIDDAGKQAKTKYEVINKFKSFTLVEAQPLTNVKHQIRLHFWSLGTPLAIDAQYGSDEPIFLSSFKRKYKEKKGMKEKPLIERLTLHLSQLSFVLPKETKTTTFKALLPKDFEITIKQLSKYCK